MRHIRADQEGIIKRLLPNYSFANEHNSHPTLFSVMTEWKFLIE